MTNPQLPLHIINISGGKDSTAVACLAIERAAWRAMEMRFVFADTGNEHPLTIEHIDYLGRALGVKIETVRADFSERFAERRRSLPAEWGKEKRRRKHSHGCDRRPGCDCPIIISPPVPDHLITRALELLHPTGNPYLDLCLLKGRFPSRKAQFCTEELKLGPCEDLVRPVLEAGRSVVSWLGERADESLARSKKPVFQRIRWAESGSACKVLWRPIHKWSATETFERAAYHGLKPNPLYQMGMRRVGCMPCINCSKGEVSQIVKRFPEQLERIREWEELVAAVSRRGDATFFAAPTVPGEGDRRASVDNITEWARTTRGGRQFDMLAEIERMRAAEEGLLCESAYGLCE